MDFDQVEAFYPTFHAPFKFYPFYIDNIIFLYNNIEKSLEEESMEIDKFTQRIEIMEKELAAIRQDIQEIVEPARLQVGWAYDDGNGDKWIVYNNDDEFGYPYGAICFMKSPEVFTEKGVFTNSEPLNPKNLILSTGRKVEI